jgi:7-carboxy-7-deazaguanine synthase
VTTATKQATVPVVEVFGPTIQGEGWPAGLPTYFVRLGGCDYRCAWCDSLHAVLPEHVREAPRLTVEEIVARLGRTARWVTLSGGNPALHELTALVDELQARGQLVAVETQGSRWRDWLGDVDHLTISPKPPSSGEATPKQTGQTYAFMERVRSSGVDASLKVVVFDAEDLRFALAAADLYNWLPFYVSVGTRSIEREPLEETAERYRDVCELVARDGSPAAKRARVLPQLHVVAWGHRLGV